MSFVTWRTCGKSLTVGTIYCLGRNYPEHAAEMKAALPSEPVVFLKPASSLVQDGGSVVIPSISNDVHHEVELVVVVGPGGRSIPPEKAYDHVLGYGVGLDMTLRDVQAEAKKKGLPWAVAKGFAGAAPVSTIVERARVPDPHALDIILRVNGEIRQKSHTSKMLFRIPAVVSYLSQIFHLEEGDLIFTGTPEGVGPVHAGDTLEAELTGVARLTVGVRPPAQH
jgi:5-carboxymethyl-2-hydroxymuconate isomerase